ncbi:hypothetical protein AWB71_05320 [Caballeronia peredens]|nr:hypothetical protein AWB71_05320 [Caballeronia peredens]
MNENEDYQLLHRCGYKVVYQLHHLFLCTETGVVKAVPLADDKQSKAQINHKLPFVRARSKIGRALSDLATAVVENKLETPHDIKTYRKHQQNKTYRVIRKLGLDVQIKGSKMLLLDEDDRVCKSLPTGGLYINHEAGRIRNGSHGDKLLHELLWFAQTTDLSTLEKRDLSSFVNGHKTQRARPERVTLRIEGETFSTVQKQ